MSPSRGTIQTRAQSRCLAVAVLAILLSTAAFAQVDGATAPAHVRQAEQLVDNLRNASENVYGGGKRHIDWSADHCAARTVCSSFITLLLQHTYGWTGDDIKLLTGSANPEADAYHDAIVDHDGFKRILHAAALRPGDFIAIKYTDHHISRNGVQDTGHVMLVDEPPVLVDSAEPIVDGTRQYTVTIIDSSASGHGPTDTRHRGRGEYTGGIGKGVIRLYANDQDRIVGYTWSNTPKSEYYCGPDRDIVAGRLRKVPSTTSGTN